MIGFLYAPDTASQVQQWVLWTSGVLGGVAVITAVLWSKKSPFRRCVSWLFHRNIGAPITAAFREVTRDAMAPDLAELSAKVDILSERNDHQHADNAAGIGALRVDVAGLRSEFVDVRSAFDEHLADADTKSRQLQALLIAADTHVAALHEDVARTVEGIETVKEKL